MVKSGDIIIEQCGQFTPYEQNPNYGPENHSGCS
jgi:hypothetical protein